MFGNLFSGFKAWYAQPYRDNMTVNRWFLFVGLMIVLLAVWKVIIYHLQEAA